MCQPNEPQLRRVSVIIPYSKVDSLLTPPNSNRRNHTRDFNNDDDDDDITSKCVLKRGSLSDQSVHQQRSYPRVVIPIVKLPPTQLITPLSNSTLSFQSRSKRFSSESLDGQPSPVDRPLKRVVVLIPRLDPTVSRPRLLTDPTTSEPNPPARLSTTPPSSSSTLSTLSSRVRRTRPSRRQKKNQFNFKLRAETHIVIQSDSDFQPDNQSSSDESVSVSKDLVQDKSPTTVVPLVYEKFQNYFPYLKKVTNVHLKSSHKENPSVGEGEEEDEDDDDEELLSRLGEDDISWIEERPFMISETGEQFYERVRLSEDILRPGETVRCLRKSRREFSYRNSRSTIYKSHYGSDSEVDQDDCDDSFESLTVESSDRVSCRRFLVRSLFERNGKKFFHGTWLEEAQHSFIGQAGNPQELLLLNQCYELEIKYVIRIESVTWVRKSFDLSREISGLFCRYHWDPTNGSIVDLPDENTIINHSPLLKTTLETCPICLSHTPDFKWLTDKATGLISLGTTDQYESLGFTLHGKETYRLKDFVRVSGQTPKDPQQIGQIVEISDIRPNPDCYRTVSLDDGPFQPSLKLPLKLARTKWPKITIRLYRRSPWPGSSVDHSPLFKDDRRLWITEEESLVDARKQLEGKCEIVHLVKKDGVMVTLNSHRKVYWESIIDRENCFYTILPDETQRRLCSVPMINKGWESELSSREPDWIKIKAEGQGESYSDLVKNYGKGRLRHLELFCGIGSMSVAFMELGLTAQQSTMFIDLEVSACQTIAVNFPRSRVICGDVNEVLELMIRGKEDDHLIDRRTGDKIFKKDLPRPGDFDLITAGFPCGSHSSLNVLRKANDSKNALCASALSFVVYLKPDYVFFENVRGLLRTKFQDSSDESAVSKAFLRLIPGTLMDAGYQVKFGVLQAAQFGSPQERRRVIFSGTRKGLTSPTLPEPTHHFPDDFLPIFLPSNTPDGKNSVKTDYRSSRSGALPAVTVGDTLSDLPPFEYINPMKIIPRVDAKSQEEIKSRKRLIPALDRVITNHEAQLNAIGYELFEYSSVPRNNYQNWLRKDMVCKQQDRFRDRENETGTDSVETIANWHITPRWSGKAVERMWHIPFVEGADHYSLPAPLKLNIKNANKISDFDGNFGRLSLDKQFKTIITTMDPKNQGACGRVLHPLQHRVLSVLEAQRAQGFPDWYRLDPGLLDPKVNFTKTLYKLVGNAIPIPICVQLGKSLMRARELDWIESGRPIEDGTIAQQVLDLIDLLRESVDV